MAGRTSNLLRPLQLVLVVLLMLGVSVLLPHHVVVVVVAVLGGVAGLEQHGEEAVTRVLRVLLAQSRAGVLDTDVGQELHEERSVEVLTQLVHDEPSERKINKNVL